MSSSKRVTLRWSGDGMVFHGDGGGPSMIIDGDSAQGPSPMDTLLLALCGCMASDLRVILEKSRVPLTALEIVAVGERAETEPRKYVSIQLVFTVEGVDDAAQAKLDRAVALSEDKYCSVLHSLNPEIQIEIEVNRI